eukprot:CAMPEP_0177781392 /NCGR_PEP_ID=MMETSP0491_2-20121128/17820_1 /TAXON_ID=63592 /ORGANISM="Tetraselmis chuii, Strain PLY429" /LENGTH=49 /DNA_ID= /DNA_START= /DNA_END= /DNA_ORIENTATION=
MRLEENSLNGTLPSEWSEFAAAQTMHLFANGLSGTLPTEWSELSNLAVM